MCKLGGSCFLFVVGSFDMMHVHKNLHHSLFAILTYIDWNVLIAWLSITTRRE